jgi:hypothetical protein
MTWHHWVENIGDDWVEHTYVFIPDEIEDMNVSEDWPEINCGPEYWMWRIAAELEDRIENDTSSEDDGE